MLRCIAILVNSCSSNKEDSVAKVVYNLRETIIKKKKLPVLEVYDEKKGFKQRTKRN